MAPVRPAPSWGPQAASLSPELEAESALRTLAAPHGGPTRGPCSAPETRLALRCSQAPRLCGSPQPVPGPRSPRLLSGGSRVVARVAGSRGCRGLDLGPGQDLKGPAAPLSRHDRVTATQTGWCWTREGRSSKPYTTSATSSRALRRPWAPKRTPPGSAETSWTVSRRWRTVRGPAGPEDGASRPRGGAGGAGVFRQGPGEMGHSNLGSSGPRFCPRGDGQLGRSFLHPTDSP